MIPSAERARNRILSKDMEDTDQDSDDPSGLTNVHNVHTINPLDDPYRNTVVGHHVYATLSLEGDKIGQTRYICM